MPKSGSSLSLLLSDGFFCSHGRQCWYVVLVSTPCVASPPLTHASSLCLWKSGTQLSPFFVALVHSPSFSFTANECLEHNYPCSPPVFLPLYPSLPIPCLSFHLLWLQEKSVKGAAAEIFIDLFSSVLFISPPSFLLSLPLRADPGTPPAPRDVRGSSAAENPQHKTII